MSGVHTKTLKKMYDRVYSAMVKHNIAIWAVQKFVVQKKKGALIRSSHQDCHFTMLGFTNTLGEPVCCVTIIAAAEAQAKDIMSLQP
jgi:hypothetical protein